MAIARALAGDPEIVWADEPTGDLNSGTSEQVLELLMQLNHENEQTFVVVMHNPDVGSVVERIVWIDDSRIAGHDRPEDYPKNFKGPFGSKLVPNLQPL